VKDCESIMEHVRTTYPGAAFRLYEFESGTVVLDISVGRGTITVECTASGKMGLSRLFGSSDGLSGHEAVFENVEDALVQIDEWLRNATEN
jgi:hypothetical protein